jgi:hypothetical protein
MNILLKLVTHILLVLEALPPNLKRREILLLRLLFLCKMRILMLPHIPVICLHHLLPWALVKPSSESRSEVIESNKPMARLQGKFAAKQDGIEKEQSRGNLYPLRHHLYYILMKWTINCVYCGAKRFYLK